MQTWAKRGMQAALVTGGMLAAGTGVASASEDCPERPNPFGGAKLTPLEAVGDGTPRASGPCYSGELFPESVARHGTGRPATTITGTIDPVRDLLPAVENSLTQQIPRIREDGPTPDGVADVSSSAPTERLWIPPEEVEQVANRIRTLELAGWVADTANPGGSTTDDAGSITPVPGHPTAAVGLLSRDEGFRGRHAAQRQFGTPADGYHRSLRWSGPIGSVVDTTADTVGAGAREASGEALPPALVRPTIDPAVVEGFDRAVSLISLWESVRARSQEAAAAQLPAPQIPAPQPSAAEAAAPETAASQTFGPQPTAGLVSAHELDLTSAVLGGGPTLHTLPEEVLVSALSSSARPAQAVQQEFVPLHVPGEHQERAHELPNLSGLESARSTGGRGAGVVLPVPGLGEMHTLGGGDLDLPEVSGIAEALDGNRHPVDPAGSRAFAPAPHHLDVSMTVVDELAAAVAERDVVARNPFREASSPRTAPAGGMALPVLDGVPEITVLQDQTLPLPRVDTHGTPVPSAPDAAATLRHVSGRI